MKKHDNDRQVTDAFLKQLDSGPMHKDAKFLEGGGEMGALMRAHNWQDTPLGNPASWPQSLKSALSICLHSPGVSALYWGPDFRMLYNDAYAPVLAERHPSALGEPLSSVWSEIWEVLGPQLNAVISTGQGFSVQNQPLMMMRHGKLEETFWVYSFTPIRGEADDFVGIFVTALDNTQQVLAQQRNAAELEQMWRTSQDLLTVVRLDGTLKTVNAAWTTLLGWHETDLLDRSVMDLVHPEDLPATLVKLADVATSPLIEPYEYRLRHKDGSYRWFSWTAAPAHGEIYANGRHTTQSHEQDAKLATASTEARWREEFIAVLGHDLRNPLASIGAATRMLLREPQSQKSADILRLAQGSVLRMSGLIDNVLDFARGRLGGGMSLARDAAEPLEDTLHQVVDELRTATDKPILADFQIGAPVSCDRPRIGQLVSNLLGNAITHGAHDKPVEIFAATDSEALEIRVCNQGEPISAAAMERLFHPFFRGEVRDSQQGLGLGLHIAAEIAKAHGGTLEATSTHEETCFTFRMPMVPATA